MNKEKLIQNYIANRLSEQEKLRVENLLKTDSEFKEIYTTHKEVAMAFQISKSDEIKKRLQKLDGVTSTTSTMTKIKKRYFRKFIRVGVAALVIFGLFYINTLTNSNNDIFESYFEVSPNTYMPITRGVNIPTKSLEFEAFKAYEANDFKGAAADFKELLKTNSNPSIQFYYAMSLLNQDKFNLALDQLNTLHNKRFEYQVETLWYTALIQAKKNNKESAKKHLTTIQQLNPNFKSTEILSILKNL